jgi:hypothetical protein
LSWKGRFSFNKPPQLVYKTLEKRHNRLIMGRTRQLGGVENSYFTFNDEVQVQFLTNPLKETQWVGSLTVEREKSLFSSFPQVLNNC